MFISQVTYLKRINLGNYEHEEISMITTLEEGDSAEEALNNMKTVIAGETAEKGEASSGPSPSGKKAKATKAPEVVDLSDEEETEEEEVAKPAKASKAKSKKFGDHLDDDMDEEEEKPAKGKGKKTIKVKLTPYDRNVASHKTLFRALLDEEYPNWAKKKKDAAGAASRMLQGVGFIDKDGEIAESFKEELSSHME